ILSAMRALYPRGPSDPRTHDLPGVEDTGIAAFLEQYRKESTALLWAGLVLGALVFTLTPLMTVWIPLPSFLLPRKVLDRHAYRVATHRLYLVRQPIVLLKMVAGLCWGSHPKIRERWHLPAYAADPGTWRTQ